ncbi:hypothetical protein P7K49_004390 [Saguinus oedipus]|uniref:Uncharacterized protein n=1 Tax=Saguinus oedipus TaxID=9490 RepID=A0ABQ9W8U5_SAGOE|nr:hypothetical protein P7K49_004390 [Saguinus oedipus]
MPPPLPGPGGRGTLCSQSRRTTLNPKRLAAAGSGLSSLQGAPECPGSRWLGAQLPPGGSWVSRQPLARGSAPSRGLLGVPAAAGLGLSSLQGAPECPGSRWLGAQLPPGGS